MMHKRFISVLLWGVITLVFLLSAAASNSLATGKYQLVRIDVPNHAAVKEIMNATGADICGLQYNPANGYVEMPLSESELMDVVQLGYSFNIVVPDLEQFYASRSAGLTMGGFRTYVECAAKLDSMVALYPTLTKKVNIGTTTNGNIVWAFKVSDNANLEEDEPEVLFTGLTHAREPIGMEICLDFANWLLTNYASNPTAQNIVNNRQVWIIPIVNPDGYLYNQQTNPNGGGMWRKNRRNNGGGSYGVDVNRNYTYMWGYDNNGSSPYPDDETYRGPSAGSEPENQRVMTFCQVHNFQMVLHYHSYGGLFIYPWGYSDILTPDNSLFTAIADSATSINGYSSGTPWQLLYNTNGDACDYSYGEIVTKNRIWGFTPEVGNDFWPAPNSIPGLITLNRPVNIFFAQLAANVWTITPPYAPVITPMTTDPDGNYTISWDVTGGDTLPDKFELQEMTGVAVVTDGAESGSGNWNMSNFTITNAQHQSGLYSFYSGQGDNYHATMTLAQPVNVTGPMNLTFYIKYDTEVGYDYAYVEVSTDGYTFTTLATFNGYSNWVAKSYSLNAYIGQQIFIRLRYDTDVYVTNPGVWIDQIYPVQTFTNIVTLSSNITGYSYDVTGRTPGTYYYHVRGHNQAGWGSYSGAEDIVVTGTSLCGDVNMTPDTYPISVPPGGSFGLTGTIGNPNGSAITTDVWVGVKYLSNFIQLWNFPNIPLNPGQYLNAHLNQAVPSYAPLGTYDYIAYCGDQPTKCDSAVFQFTVAGARLENGADQWTLNGGWDVASETPSDYALLGSYPNPFNAVTSIIFEVPTAGKVNLDIYNLMGQKVATLVDSDIEAGQHSISWDAANFSSGIYFYKLSAGDKVFTKRMTLLK
ncbi:MAG: hypothetical protein CO189_10825 [candidate division Zixibacteria bacterium CG_4_9_14_3_um_filter_46_8]|nr:MAG: hypothetical protein CO189_10825 [candidate division Zixibacteria bacterium CG_4_9_14_3_um_filter_46_8]